MIPIYVLGAITLFCTGMGCGLGIAKSTASVRNKLARADSCILSLRAKIAELEKQGNAQSRDERGRFVRSH